MHFGHGLSLMPTYYDFPKIAAILFLENAGTYGLVDYTNYEDMKYAVSIILVQPSWLSYCYFSAYTFLNC